MIYSKELLFSASCLAMGLIFCSPVSAKSTFLPDWQQAGLTFGVDTGGDQNKDENYCKEALDSDGSKFYHKASGCTKPKVFNETCPTDPDYISKCYCPSVYNKTCTSPYKGDEREKEKGYASCDGKYIACCSTICSAGEVGKSCSGTDIRYVAGSNGCGETCYACRPCRNDCTTSCGSNENAHTTGSYSECGRACVTCTPKCTPSSNQTGCSCGTYTCSDGCGGTRTCCSSCSSGGSSGGSSGSSSGGSSSSSGGGSGKTCTKYYTWKSGRYTGSTVEYTYDVSCTCTDGTSSSRTETTTSGCWDCTTTHWNCKASCGNCYHQNNTYAGAPWYHYINYKEMDYCNSYSVSASSC